MVIQKLGKLSPKIDPRTLKLAKYLTPNLPTPPDLVDWTRGKTEWGMLANDRLGDCTIAMVAHGVETYCMNTWGEVLVTDEEVISYYSKWCGYDPADPSTDQGGYLLDVMKGWRNEGFGVPGRPAHQTHAFVEIDPDDEQHFKIGAALFGTVCVGVALPIAVQGKKYWNCVPRAHKPSTWPGSWGGHAIVVVGYDFDKIYFVSWGEIYTMSWAFCHAYVDEAFVPLHKGWYPPGFLIPQLEEDLQALAKTP